MAKSSQITRDWRTRDKVTTFTPESSAKNLTWTLRGGVDKWCSTSNRLGKIWAWWCWFVCLFACLLVRSFVCLLVCLWANWFVSLVCFLAWLFASLYSYLIRVLAWLTDWLIVCLFVNFFVCFFASLFFCCCRCRRRRNGKAHSLFTSSPQFKSGSCTEKKRRQGKHQPPRKWKMWIEAFSQCNLEFLRKSRTANGAFHQFFLLKMVELTTISSNQINWTMATKPTSDMTGCWVDDPYHGFLAISIFHR